MASEKVPNRSAIGNSSAPLFFVFQGTQQVLCLMRALLTRQRPCFNDRFVTMGGMPPIPLYEPARGRFRGRENLPTTSYIGGIWLPKVALDCLKLPSKRVLDTVF